MKLIIVLIACSFIVPIMCNRINSKVYEEILAPNHIVSDSDQQSSEQSRNSQSNDQQPNNQMINDERNENVLSYVKTSIPIRIFKCMQRLNILKCMKIFILQRMERTPTYANSGNLTVDFLDQILSNNPIDGETTNDDSLDKFYVQMPEVELNDRLVKSFQRFFHDREIKLHFIPGMVVKVVPNQENALNLSLKRGANTWLESSGRKKNSPGEYLLQLGVPAVLMPAILMGTILPFILPALKFATIFSGLVNHAALLSAFAFVAKQQAFSPDSIKHLYYNPGYRRAA